jgi:pyruvate dehydrogenase E2 component (dihydrolipoamide acetyltransferase)
VAIDIVMPALSPGMEKGHLARWLKCEGDAIAAGDIIAEIETDKATLELEASEAGILSQIVVPAGSSDVPVNQRIAVLREAAAAHIDQTPAVIAPPVVPSAATEGPIAIEAPARVKGAEPSDRLLASPRARRLAGELGVDLARLRGSGPLGRILECNVRDAIATAMAQLRADPAASAPALRGDRATGAVSHATERSAGADMRGSVAPTYLTSHIEVDALIALLERINEVVPRGADGPSGYAATLDDLVVKAWAQALSETPDANLSLEDGEAIRRDAAAIAIICQGAPIAPVLRLAATKSIAAIAREREDLAARARAGTLQAGECAGSTSAISGLGIFGVEAIAASLHPTHATALACGAIEKRMVVRDDAAVLARVMTVTLSLDPGVISVATGAALVAAFRSRLEAPMRLLA